MTAPHDSLPLLFGRASGATQPDTTLDVSVPIASFREAVIAGLADRPDPRSGTETSLPIGYDVDETATPAMGAFTRAAFDFTFSLLQKHLQTRAIRPTGWRTRLEALRLWRGNPAEGEAEQLSAQALFVMHRIGLLSDVLSRRRGTPLEMRVVPLTDGGVQAEWTCRGAEVEHFEIAVMPDRLDRYEVLATTETIDGRIQDVHREISDATLAELLVAFEEFLGRVSRLALQRG
jgi:hypothetical protein